MKPGPRELLLLEVQLCLTIQLCCQSGLWSPQILKALVSLPLFPVCVSDSIRESWGGRDTQASQKQEKGISDLSWVSPVEPQHLLVRAWSVLLPEDSSALHPPGTAPQL